MINKLTKEQESMIPIYFNKWKKMIIGTPKIDQQKTEEVIKWAYEFTGFDAPTKFIYLDSPLACNLAIHMLKNNQLGSQLGRQLDSQLDSQLGSQLYSQLSSQLVSQLGSQLYSQLSSQLHSQLSSQFRMQFGRLNENKLYTYVYKKFWWAGYYCFYDFILNELFPEKIKDYPLFDKVKEFCQYSNIFFPFEDIVFVSRNPVEVIFNENGQLHNENGASVMFADGTYLLNLDGIGMTEEIMENILTKSNPEKILAIENAEQRLVAIKYFGVGNMLKELDDRVIDTYKDYVLHEITIEGGREKLLEMQNPSEPKKHYEFVPPEINTCKQAMAWRIGLDIYSEPKTYS